MIPDHIKILYRYFLGKEQVSKEAFSLFCCQPGSKSFVKKYAIPGRQFYTRYMRWAREKDPFHQSMQKYYQPTYTARAFKRK